MVRDYTLSFGQANVYAIAATVPIALIYMSLYGLLYGGNVVSRDLMIYFTNIPVFIITVIAGTSLHEGLHALCWIWLGDIPKEKVHFGFKWRTLTPYVHCSEPIRIDHYRWGVAMPGLVLGLIPYLLALLLHVGWLFGFGIIFSLAAGGDLLILWLLRNVTVDHFVQDHPELIGCIVIKVSKKEENKWPGINKKSSGHT